MKCVLLLLLVSAVVTLSQAYRPSQEMIEIIKKMDTSYTKCFVKNNVTEANLNNLQKFQLDKNMQCTIACIAKEMDIVKSDNTVDKTKLDILMEHYMEHLKQLNQEDSSKQIKEIIDICLPLQKPNSDECAAANKAAECVIENGKKNGFIPASR